MNAPQVHGDAFFTFIHKSSQQKLEAQGSRITNRSPPLLFIALVYRNTIWQLPCQILAPSILILHDQFIACIVARQSERRLPHWTAMKPPELITECNYLFGWKYFHPARNFADGQARSFISPEDQLPLIVSVWQGQ